MTAGFGMIEVVLLGGGGLLFLVGLVLAWLSWRGRLVGTEPRCGKCGFDLTGIAGGADCPECGAAAGRRRKGRRERRVGWLAVGLVLLVVGTVGLALVLAPVAQRGNWNGVKPLWLLEYDARSASQPRVAGAVNELRSRIADGRLSDEQIDALIQTGLALQADPALPWVSAWGDLLYDAWLGGRLTGTEAERFVENAVTVGVVAPPRAIAGRSISVGLEMSAPRGPGAASIRLVNGPVLLRLLDADGTVVDMLWRERGGMLSVGHGGRTSSSWTLPVDGSLATGEYSLVVEIVQAVVPREDDFGVRLDWDAITAGNYSSVPELGFVRDATAEALVEVLAVGTPLWRYVRPVPDDSVSEAVGGAVVIDELTPTGMMVTLHDLPAPVAFVVEWRRAGSGEAWREHSNLVGMATAGSHGFGSMGLDGVEAGDRVDVRLRADLGVAFDKGLEEIWWGEVVFEGVEVTAQRGQTAITPNTARVLPVPVGAGGP